jgi:hypothetical protein
MRDEDMYLIVKNLFGTRMNAEKRGFFSKIRVHPRLSASEFLSWLLVNDIEGGGV